MPIRQLDPKNLGHDEDYVTSLLILAGHRC